MNPSGKYLTIVMIGYNDFAVDGDSTATFLSQLYAYTDARRAAGHKVVVVDVTPSTTVGLNTWRATVNADVAANVGVHLDYRVDLSGTSIGADGDASDVAKYSDGIHPTAATAIVIADAIKTQAIDVEAAL
jgi:lysophospholipase L1-like esterase